MKKLFYILLLLLLLPAISVGATDIEPVEPPQSALELIPQSTGDFGQDLLYIIRSAFRAIRPDLAEGLRVCLSVFASVMLLSLLHSTDSAAKTAVQICAVVTISGLLLGSVNSMIHLGTETVQDISQYGRMLLPVMTAALAAQGGTASSAALYAGTALFDSVLSTAISSLLIPMVYIFLTLGILSAATGEALIKQLQDMIKWLLTWCLKIILYVFTGYISITGVVSGTTDQAALKAAKLTISGAVPVVGGILSDASEAVVVSVRLAKNAAGIYGILALIAIFIGPFLTIGLHAGLLRLTSVCAGAIGDSKYAALIDTFSAAMGFLLAMTGAICIMQLISTVCFMKGMG